MTATAYPLAWPDGWPRSRYPRAWKQASKWTFARARDGLLKELRLLGARQVVLSTNYELGTRTNLPLKKGNPSDKGVAVYFLLKGKPLCMACDKYSSPEGNIRSLTLAIGGMRALERHGGGVMMEKAFAGFEALPPPSGATQAPQRDCWRILGLSGGEVTEARIRAAYRKLAMECHPDQGGSDQAMRDLVWARDQALAAIAVRGGGNRP